MAVAQLIVSGTITQSPPSVVGTTISASPLGTVPAGVTQIPLVLSLSPKPSAKRASGNKVLNSPSSFQAISGIGPTDDVVNCDTLYLKSDSNILVQLTIVNPAGGTFTSTISLYGMMMMEFATNAYCTGISAQGNANLEYLFSGPS